MTHAQKADYWIVEMSMSQCDKAFSSEKSALEYQSITPHALPKPPIPVYAIKPAVDEATRELREALEIQRLVLISIASGGCEGSTVCIEQQDSSCCNPDSGIPKEEWCVPCHCSHAITAAEKLLKK